MRENNLDEKFCPWCRKVMCENDILIEGECVCMLAPVGDIWRDQCITNENYKFAK